MPKLRTRKPRVKTAITLDHEIWSLITKVSNYLGLSRSELVKQVMITYDYTTLEKIAVRYFKKKARAKHAKANGYLID